MDLGIAGRCAIICASSMGLGRACAMALVREGVDVVVNGRHGDSLEATRRDIEAETDVTVTAVLADVTTPRRARRSSGDLPGPGYPGYQLRRPARR